MSLQPLIEGKVKRPEPKPEQFKTRSVKLVDHSGQHFDDVQVSAAKNLPDCIIWGVADRQRIFLRDGKGYKEASWIQAPMPDFVPM
jgi:hypothetical protein